MEEQEERKGSGEKRIIMEERNESGIGMAVYKGANEMSFGLVS